MKRGLAVVATLCLILGFQNCSQSSLEAGEGLNGKIAVSIHSPESVVDAVNASVTYLEIPQSDESISVGVSAKASSSAAGALRLVVSTQTGKISLVDAKNEVFEERCLSSEDLQEMKTILAGSSICSKVVSEDTMCAMSYTPAYVSLYANEERIQLGEKMDSCGTGSKDLCGGLADVFQSYVGHIKANWESMACAQ